tara:strand:+ start:3339 stop:3800 length:462 start_codon:yes stop_codon:yes gene_type:complete
MNYEHITTVTVILVTLVILWYVDKEIKILRSDVVNMKEALSINVQMFQKLRHILGSNVRPGDLMYVPKRQEQNDEQKLPSESAPQQEKDKDEATVNVSNVHQEVLETIQEEEPPEQLKDDTESLPVASNDIPVQQEQTKPPTKRGGRRKIPSN